MEELTFTIAGPPRVKKSNQRVVWTGRHPKKLNTPAYHTWEQDALWQLAATPRRPKDPIDYPVNLCCRFYMPTRGRVDLSALYEGIQDCLVRAGILLDDNYLVVASHDGSGVEVDRENPRMEITITPKEQSNEQTTSI